MSPSMPRKEASNKIVAGVALTCMHSNVPLQIAGLNERLGTVGAGVLGPTVDEGVLLEGVSAL